jgi:YesN/AraC family two-component response regulator
MAKARVLFVDDEPGIRATLPAVLGMHDFETVAVASVTEALDIIQREKFDVLLSDLNIGEPGDGFTVVSAMRRVQPQAVTIIITGYPAFETALEAIRQQVDDYVVKPADAKQLVETIEQKLTGERGKVHRPMPTKRVWQIVDEERDAIVRQWLELVEKMPEIAAVPLNQRERSDHIPAVLDELVRMLKAAKSTDVSRKALKAAAKHGVDRRSQGYTIPMVLEESRVLRRCVNDSVQRNLLRMEISMLLPDLSQMEESLCLQINESVRAFLGAARRPEAA